MIQFVLRVCKLEPKWLRTDEKHVGFLPFIFQGGTTGYWGPLKDTGGLLKGYLRLKDCGTKAV